MKVKLTAFSRWVINFDRLHRWLKIVDDHYRVGLHQYNFFLLPSHFSIEIHSIHILYTKYRFCLKLQFFQITARFALMDRPLTFYTAFNGEPVSQLEIFVQMLAEYMYEALFISNRNVYHESKTYGLFSLAIKKCARSNLILPNCLPVYFSLLVYTLQCYDLYHLIHNKTV